MQVPRLLLEVETALALKCDSPLDLPIKPIGSCHGFLLFRESDVIAARRRRQAAKRRRSAKRRR
jgi:hypothetical protein